MLASALRRRAAAALIPPSRSPRRACAPRFASTTPADPPASPKPSSALKYLRALSAAASVALTAYTLGSLYPPTLATYISPRPAAPPPHPDDPASLAYLAALEDELQRLPALAALRARADAAEWYEARPYERLPEERRVHSLTAGALRGPGRLALTPLVRCRRDSTESWYFVHVGRSVCGHEGIVHGGLLATMLDEMLGRLALLNLPEKIGVTASLSLRYRAPTRADQFLVVKTYVKDVEGRKARVFGVIEDLSGTVLVEADALFIQPRYAKLLNTKQMRELIGEPIESKEPITPGSMAPVPVALPGGGTAMGGLKA
ncbi:Thioesterase/thiol ester dehydrase-isomerase [Amylocystis lapponica]|nr:Thioesterase/thiol ester dehydrase-isomerase [Amylocystis lapponica]